MFDGLLFEGRLLENVGEDFHIIHSFKFNYYISVPPPPEVVLRKAVVTLLAGIVNVTLRYLVETLDT